MSDHDSRSTSKVYGQHLKYFERPVTTNVGYNYSLLTVFNPHDLVIKINDELGKEFESQLTSAMKNYADHLNKASNLDDYLLGSTPLYEGMPVVLEVPGDEKGEEGNLVRAEILSFDGKKVQLALVDFGTGITAMEEELYQISVDLMRIPKVGVRCRMAQIEPEKGEWPRTVAYENDLKGKSQVVVFTDYYPHLRCYEVCIQVDNVSVTTKYFHKGIAQPVPPKLFPKVQAEPERAIPRADYSAWVGLKTIAFGVRVFHEEDEEEKGDPQLKCVLQMQPEVVNTIQDIIAAYIADTPSEVKNRPFPKTPKTPCLARFGEDEYFRAIIEKKVNDEYLVEYVDYQDKTVLAASDLLYLPDSLLDFPIGAVICQMTDFLSISCKDFKKLVEVVENKDLYAVVDGCDPRIFGNELLVTLFQPVDFTGPDISFAKLFNITDIPPMIKEVLQEFEPVDEVDEAIFLQSRLPDPMKLYPGATLSCVNAWDSLWIQLEEEGDLATRVTKELTHFYENGGCHEEIRKEFTTRMKPGNYVAAQQADEDENYWYRAKVVEMKDDDDKALVFYFDHGNSDWVLKEELYPLHKYFAKEHKLSFEVAFKTGDFN